MAIDSFWHRQLIESMKRASELMDCYRASLESNVDQYEEAITLHKECCEAYQLEQIDFEEFLDFGKGLRARQAHKMILKDYANE